MFKVGDLNNKQVLLGGFVIITAGSSSTNLIEPSNMLTNHEQTKTKSLKVSRWLY